MVGSFEYENINSFFKYILDSVWKDSGLSEKFVTGKESIG